MCREAVGMDFVGRLALYSLHVVVLVCCFFFFFFQAEDGIRDKLVTGVQTCALPISFRLLAVAERVQRILFHRRVLAGLSTHRFFAGAARLAAAATAVWKVKR